MGWLHGPRLYAMLGITGLSVLLFSWTAALGDDGSATARLGVLEEPVAAPALEGEAVDGGTVDLREHAGQVVLVNLWASWCAPCRREMPLLVDAARRYRDRGLVVLGVNTNDRRESARRFLDEVAPTDSVRHLFDPEGTAAVEWGARGLPETFVVDRDGRIVARLPGEVTEAWLSDVVLPRLAS